MTIWKACTLDSTYLRCIYKRMWKVVLKRPQVTFCLDPYSRCYVGTKLRKQIYLISHDNVTHTKCKMQMSCLMKRKLLDVSVPFHFLLLLVLIFTFLLVQSRYEVAKQSKRQQLKNANLHRNASIAKNTSLCKIGLHKSLVFKLLNWLMIQSFNWVISRQWRAISYHFKHL